MCTEFIKLDHPSGLAPTRRVTISKNSQNGWYKGLKYSYIDVSVVKRPLLSQTQILKSSFVIQPLQHPLELSIKHMKFSKLPCDKHHG